MFARTCLGKVPARNGIVKGKRHANRTWPEKTRNSKACLFLYSRQYKTLDWGNQFSGSLPAASGIGSLRLAMAANAAYRTEQIPSRNSFTGDPGCFLAEILRQNDPICSQAQAESQALAARPCSMVRANRKTLVRPIHKLVTCHLHLLHWPFKLVQPVSTHTSDDGRIAEIRND